MSKIVKITIEEVPDGYERPYISKVEPPKNLVALTDADGLDTVSFEETNIRIDYPIQKFAYNSKHKEKEDAIYPKEKDVLMETYYIRDKDMQTFSDLINGFVKMGNYDILVDYILEQHKKAGLGDSPSLLELAKHNAEKFIKQKEKQDGK